MKTKQNTVKKATIKQVLHLIRPHMFFVVLYLLYIFRYLPEKRSISLSMPET